MSVTVWQKAALGKQTAQGKKKTQMQSFIQQINHHWDCEPSEPESWGISHMAESMKEHTVIEKVRKNVLNFAVSKAPFHWEWPVQCQQDTAQHLHFAMGWIKHSMPGAQPKRLRNYGNGVGCNGKERYKWLLSTPGGAESRDIPLGDSPADLSQELWHCPSLPRALAASASPRKSDCLYLENACFSISAIYNFHVQKIFIIKIFIMACNVLHSTMYLGYMYIYRYISNSFHLPAASWMEARIANEKAREYYIGENTENWGLCWFYCS